MSDKAWLLVITITSLAILFDRLLARWERYKLKRDLRRTLSRIDGGRFIKPRSDDEVTQ